MVKATPAGAKLCSESATPAKASCTKSESTFDIVSSEFSIPTVGSTITVFVCDASIYYEGQWLYFPVTGDRLQIASISVNNNILYLRNGCDDLVTPIAENRDPGNIISKSSPFYAVDSPDCLTDEEKGAELLRAINLSLCVEMQALQEAGTTEKVQVLGRVLSDPSNASFKKCMKRIVGFFANLNGRLFMEKLDYVDEDQITDYTDVMLKSSTKELVRRKMPASRGLSSAIQYPLVQHGGAVRYVKGGKIFVPLETPILIKDSTNLLISNAQPRLVGDISVTHTTPYNITKVLNGDEIDAMVFNESSFYALVDIECYAGGSSAADIEYLRLLVNNVDIVKIPTLYSPSVTVSVLAKCLKTTKEVKISIFGDLLNPSITSKIILKAYVKGIYL